MIDIYGRAFEKQWFRDNKPHGFDLQDHRIGALLRAITMYFFMHRLVT